MRIVFVELSCCAPTAHQAASFGPTTAELELEQNFGFARALARRGHETHVLSTVAELPDSLLPVTVHEWRAMGEPVTLRQAYAPFHVHVARPGCLGPGLDASPLWTRWSRALGAADVVIGRLAAGEAGPAVELARALGAALIFRLPPLPQDDAEGDERLAALAAADLVLCPSEAARAAWIASWPLTGTEPAVASAVLGEGLDARALAPEPRSALSRTPAPPLPAGLGCVLFDGDATESQLGVTLSACAANILVRRQDLGLVLPRSGDVASADGSANQAARARVFTVDSSEVLLRSALAQRTRLAVLPDDSRLADVDSARSALRAQSWIARGVLPLARAHGATGECLRALAQHLPESLGELLQLPNVGELDAGDLGRRLAAVLDHPELPYLGARLAALAVREFDWSVRGHTLDHLLAPLVRVVPLRSA